MKGGTKFKVGDLTIRLMLGYLVIIIMFLCVSFIANYSLKKTQTNLEYNSNIFLPEINIASQIKSIVHEQQALTGRLAFENQNIKARYRQLDRLFKAQIEEFKQLANDGDMLEIVSDVERQHDNFNLVANHIFKYKEEGREELVNNLWKNYVIAGSKMIKSTDKLVEISNQNLKLAELESKREVKASRKTIYIMIVVTLILGTFLSIYTSQKITSPLFKIVQVSKEIATGDLTQRVDVKSIEEFDDLAHSFNKMVDNLQEIIEKVVVSVKRISGACENLEGHTRQSVDIFKDINLSVEEVSTGSSQQVEVLAGLRSTTDLTTQALTAITNNILSIENITSTTAKQADLGGTSVQMAIEQTKVIQHKFDKLEVHYAELEDDIKQISKIVEMILSFAKQTHILAINASIEASRAGEHGRQFAVVAEAVGELANDSRALTAQIQKIISGIQKRSQTISVSMQEGCVAVNTGVDIINQVGTQFTEIIKAAQTASQRTQGVVNSSQQIADVSKSIEDEMNTTEKLAETADNMANKVFNMINSHTQEVDRLSKNVSHLNQMAAELEKAVAGFKLKG